ncbi:MAG TPA: DUF4917 family protein [Arachidicoccus sp.]|nr:DUF4917 family protein [Arachidicoccus sp.]
MEIDGVSLLSYQEVLEIIEGQENHLLLGNGFNRGLGIDTSYSSIFQKMIENNHGIYKDVANLVKVCDFDLEKFIGELEKDIEPENIFLRKYINNKVKMDFMQATHEIVKSEIKNIYAEKNDGVFILLKQFTNYFTLNYDSFLYLLLLNYKSLDTGLNTAFSLQPSLKFVQEDLNIRHNEVYNEIKQIRNGSLSITINPDINPTKTPIDKVTKSTFTTIIKQYAKSNQKKWKTKIILQVVNFILEEEKKNQVLKNVDDGAQLKLFQGAKEFVFDLNSRTQNLFFLHGAFHIYKDGESIKKITQQADKALYDRLESILNNEEQEIVCVFQSEDKLDAIKKNEYLQKCYNELSGLSGNFVILGSALSDNDNHIFEQVNRSKIENVFISATSFTEEKVKVAKRKFTEKKIYFFDVNTITYKKPEEN